MNRKALLKLHHITEKQAALLELVAKHPIFGAIVPEVGRVVPGALRAGHITEVWLDRSGNVIRTVTDYHPGCTRHKTTSNRWYELSENAVRCLEALTPGWTYDRPSAKWPGSLPS